MINLQHGTPQVQNSACFSLKLDTDSGVQSRLNLPILNYMT